MLPLKNQFIFPPIKTGFGDGSGVVTEKHLAFYGKRSAHLGAVTTEPLYLDKSLRELPAQIGIDNDDKIAGLRKLTGLIHNTDTKAIAHLNHPGRMANPKNPNNYFVSATDRPCENRGAVPRRMIKEDIDRAIELFRRSAIRAQQAGFDIIELQFGHGYLLAQFLSPEVNDRRDEYGGSFENRCRFPLMVFDAVRQAVDLPIIVRVSGDEMTPSGIKIDETIQLAKKLAARGAAAIHVSAGTVCSTPPWFFQHMFVPKGETWEMARQIRDHINIPVIAVGQINEFQDIEKIKSEKISDYIAIGRALVADADFVGKYLGIVRGDIRPCPACAEGCLGEIRAGHGLHCVVNPLVGNDYDEIEPASEKKRYAVVGGGLAGLEAALTLKQRGHDVALYEKDKLGGQFNLCLSSAAKAKSQKSC